MANISKYATHVVYVYVRMISMHVHPSRSKLYYAQNIIQGDLSSHSS